MGQSLQDQLLASGLANKKQARKAKQDKARQKPKKNQKKNAPAPDTEQDRIAREAAAAAEAKRARDRQQSAAANEKRREKERRAAVDQLIARHVVAREPAPEDDPPYSFTMDGRIRRLSVSRNQRARLADGRLGIVRRGENSLLVERRIAERLIEMIPERVVLNTPTPSAADDPDDPYAGYEVPDDLMW